MKLIEATEEDLELLIHYWYSLAKEMEQHDKLNKLSYSDKGEISVDEFRDQLTEEDFTNYIITHEGNNIGFVTTQEGDHSSRQHSHYLRIVDLAIDENHRNQGHGTAAIEQIKRIARDRGCDHLKVSCEWQNDGARRFYRDLGFRQKQIDFAQSLE